MNIEICLVPETNLLGILSVDKLTMDPQNQIQYLNKIDIYNLDKLSRLSKQMDSLQIINSQDTVSNNIFTSKDKRDKSIYFEGPFKAMHFSISKKNRLIILRNDHQVMICQKLSSENFTLIPLKLSSISGMLLFNIKS